MIDMGHIIKTTLCFACLVILCVTSDILAQNITLPPPQTTGGMAVMDAIQRRRSIKYFKDQDIPIDLLSTLLWAANGINRPESGKRTAPVFHDIHNILIYVAKKEGLFLYHADSNQLELVKALDIRSSAGRLANVHLIYVADYSFTVDHIERLSAAHTGFIGQNVYLACAANELATVIQSTLDKNQLKSLMNLNTDQNIMLVQSIGYPVSPSQLNKAEWTLKQYLNRAIQSFSKNRFNDNQTSDITLPEPQKQGGIALLEALSERKSSRLFKEDDISIQTLSDLLWSAFGINRPASGKRTAPSAYNTQNIDIYIAMKNGAYQYHTSTNRLEFIVNSDVRPMTYQESDRLIAPVQLIYVGNRSVQLGDFYFYSYAHAGCIAQNVYVFCAANRLGTVIQNTPDREQLHQILNLTSEQEIIFTQSVGLPKIPVNAADSLGLVSLYHSANGVNWTNQTQWLEGRVSDWFGVTENNGYVTGLDLHDNHLQGIIPTEIGYLDHMQSLDLSGNQISDAIPETVTQCGALNYFNISDNFITGLPDITSLTQLDTCFAEGNRLSFRDIETNISIPVFTYSPQDSIGTRQDTLIDEYTQFEITINVDGENNQYQWLKDSVPVVGAIQKSISFSPVRIADEGRYECHISNTMAPDLTLYSRPVNIHVVPGELIPAVNTADSLGLVSLYHSTNGENWTDHAGWLQGPVMTWFGITLDNGHVIRLDLHGNHLQGSIPVEIGLLDHMVSLNLSNNQISDSIPVAVTRCSALKHLNISGNHLSDLPDMTSLIHLDSVLVDNNRLTFEDIEPNITIPVFIYSPQDSIGISKDTTVAEDSKLDLFVKTAGKANEYQWFRNGVLMTDATADTLTLSSVDQSDSGTYFCQVTNTSAIALTLYTRAISVTVLPAMANIGEAEEAPDEFHIYQNYPNPFNHTTSIHYQLPEYSHIQINIYNYRGEKITTLIDKNQQAGIHRIQWQANNLPSGLYIYQINVNDHENVCLESKMTKMVYMK